MAINLIQHYMEKKNPPASGVSEWDYQAHFNHRSRSFPVALRRWTFTTRDKTRPPTVDATY